MAVERGWGGGREALAPLDFVNFIKERLLSYFRLGKNIFYHFWPPLQQFGKCP